MVHLVRPKVIKGTDFSSYQPGTSYFNTKNNPQQIGKGMEAGIKIP